MNNPSKQIHIIEINQELVSELAMEEVINANNQQLLEFAVKQTNQAYMSMIKAGVALIKLQNQCEHGEFLESLEKAGFAKQRAYELIKYAQFTQKLPATQRKKLTQIQSKTKAVLLAHADQEVIDDLLNDEEGFEDLQNMSVRDLKEDLKKRKHQVADLNVQNDTLKAQLKEATSKNSRALTGGVIPIFIEDLRNEACAMEYKSRLCIDDIQALSNELMSTASASDEVDAYLIGFKALFTATNSILNHALTLRNFMIEQYPEAAHSEYMPIESMVAAEALRLAGDMKLISQEHAHEKLVRENQRELSRPKGRGRPRKQDK